MAWDFANGVPIYQQIISMLKMQIAAGRYGPDEKLPSVRDLAVEAGVNPNTMQRALAQMEQEGFLYTNRTAGRHVTSDPEKIKALRQQLAEGEIERMFRKLQGIGMSREDIVEQVRTWDGGHRADDRKSPDVLAEDLPGGEQRVDDRA